MKGKGGFSRHGRLLETTEDGYEIPPVGPWAEKKYSLVRFYDELFSTGMKNEWGTRVYIDLFAGPGKVRVEGSSRILWGSPLIALGVPDKFDKYFFCEKDERNLASLQARVQRYYPDADVTYFGDCNLNIRRILGLIPQASSSRKVLTFCFVDPFSLALDFATIRILSDKYVDFLMLLALSMDGARNEIQYIKENNDRIDNFLDDTSWRTRWTEYSKKDASFVRFLGREFVEKMVGLEYKGKSRETMELVRSDENRLPLYHLAFFSRHEKGYDFWNKARKYHSDQTLLDL